MKSAGSDKVRVAVVGAGYLGKYHAQKYAAMDGVELVGVVDTNRERAETVARTFGVASFTDLEAIVRLVNAASVVVPTSQHFPVARALLQGGLDVLIEKPMTASLPEATELIRLARKRGRVLQVGHLERFNAVWKAAEAALESPRFVEAHRLGPFQERGTDVDVVLDLMIHDIDILLKYVRSPVRSIDAVGVPVLSPNVDIANVRIHFANGTVANLTASRVSLKRTRKIRFFQPDVYVSIDYDDREVLILRRIRNPQSGAFEISGEQQKVPEGDALEDELRAFIRSVKTREPPQVGGEEGRKALQVALRILRRMRTG